MTYILKRPSRFRVALVAAAMATAGTAGIVSWPAVAAAACSPNPVVCENQKPGTPDSEWDINGIGDDTIQGFTTDISANVGGQVKFKIKTDAHAYTIDIYRLGWYGGDGARKVASVTPSATLPQNQPACYYEVATEFLDCGNWAVSATWTVPSDAVSGVYIAKLTRSDDGGASHVPFVVRDDSSHSDMLFQTSDTTWQAYNLYGGSDFYEGAANGRGYKLSYNRPYLTRGGIGGRDFLFANEYPMIRFLERNGYDLSYTSGIDSDRRGDLIRNHKAFLSVGHDEYWSGAQRANVEAARDAGVHLAFLSGNEVYWKVRYENSHDGTATPYRTLVCYKESWDGQKIDPSTEWTGTWRDPRLSPPSNGGRPENALTGSLYMSNSDDLTIQVPAAQGKYRLWRNTSVANLAPGQTATLAPHTIGYESNEDPDNGFRPAGLIHLSTTTGPTPEYVQDFSRTVAPGTTTHHLTLYRAASGALVFSAGSIQYSWGLDSNHDGDYKEPADARMQQATINLFADMGVQPATLMSGMVAATKSTDTQAPTVTITSPAANATFANGAAVTVTGTATDAGGGTVAVVEVSTDGGNIWYRATGTTSWSYTYNATGAGTNTIRVRASDDSVNLSTQTTRTVLLTGPTSLFGDRVPATQSVNDSGPLTLGVKFTAREDGMVSGVRFYKGSGNGGTHTGALWTANGTRLATGTFTNETSTGWQTLLFPAPVPITKDTVYVASYYAPQGHYAAEEFFFAYRDYAAPPLIGPRGDGNGVYAGGDAFPISSHQFTSYLVDVLFSTSDMVAPSLVSAYPRANAGGVPVTAHPVARLSKSVIASSVRFTLTDAAGTQVAGSTTYDDSAHTVTFTPNAELSPGTRYTATVQADDARGRAVDPPASWSFTTDPFPGVARLFDVEATPTDPEVPDAAAVSLGVRFVPAVSGRIVGIRYYQGAGNTGTHTGSLWSAGGTLLGRATFTNETGTGWQTATFATPVEVHAGATYTASYFAPNGHYAADGGYFATARTSGQLTAGADSNGVYVYGSDAFPVSTYQATNYWVDPIFVPDPPPGTNPDGTYSVFPATQTPANPSWNDPYAIEVGMRFSVDTAGSVTGVRFYKGPQNTGTHVGSLWTADGQLLANVTFTNETATGWQTAAFSQPVAIQPGVTYVVSYSAPSGGYAADIGAFTEYGLHRPPLHVPAMGGMYHYGSGFPDAPAAHNFWVDVTFAPAGSP